MTPTIKTKRFITCPGCGSSDGFSIEHLFDDLARTGHETRSFGPWYCREDECDVCIGGTVSKDGTVDINVGKREHTPGLALLRFGDLYLVLNAISHNPESDDYFYHSHQCPTNLMRQVREVFDERGRDPHGRLRYVAAIESTPQTRYKLDGVSGLEELFKLFGTDGKPAPTKWPEEDRGVIPMIAQWQREAKAGKT